jgi:hypothetical protein
MFDLFSNGLQKRHSFAKVVLEILGCGRMFFDIRVFGAIDFMNQIFDGTAKPGNIPGRTAARAFPYHVALVN